VLTGKVHLKCPKDGHELELTADRLSIKVNTVKSAKLPPGFEALRGWIGYAH
jgi:hypothetical protein